MVLMGDDTTTRPLLDITGPGEAPLCVHLVVVVTDRSRPGDGAARVGVQDPGNGA